MKKIRSYKVVFKDVVVNKKLLLILFLGLLIISGIALLVPLYMGQVVDLIISNKQEDFYKIVMLITILYIIKYVMGIFIKKKFVDISQDVNEKLQIKLLRKSIKLKMEYYDFHEKGYVLSRISEANSISGLFSPNVISIAMGILDLFIALIAIFKLNTWMSLIVILLIPIYYLTIFKYTKKIKDITKNSVEASGHTSSMSYEILSSVAEIKILNKYERHIRAFIQVFQALKNHLISQGKTMVMYMENTQVLSSIVTIIVLLFSGYNIFQGNFTLGLYTSFAAFTNRIFGNVQSIASMGITLNPILVSLDRVSEFLNYDEEDDTLSIQSIKKPIACIDFNNISFSYPSDLNSLIISNFKLTVKNGERVWFTGENGKGKSTLIKLLLGLYSPTEGDIYFDNLSIKAIRKESLREKISIVSQDSAIFKGTVKENILYGCSEDKAAKLDILIMKFSLTEYLNSFSNGLETQISQQSANISGGQSQFVSFMRAILMEKEILVLDEPTSNLDKNVKKIVADIICDNSIASIIILISHDNFLDKHEISDIFTKVEIC